MRHLFMSTQHNESFKIALLIKNNAFNKQELLTNYMKPLEEMGIDPQEVIAFTLNYTSQKITAKEAKEYLEQLMPVLNDLKVEHLYVADAAYFKVLTGQTKAEPHHGYALPCKIKGYEHMHVVLGIHYGQLIYNPEVKAKMDLGLKALADKAKGTYQALGEHIIHSAWYPKGIQEIKEALLKLLEYPSLSCDIEGFSLRFNEAGIGTITFCWDEHNGVAFAVDYQTDFALKPHPRSAQLDPHEHGFFLANMEIRGLLKEFFEAYQGKLTFHHAPYDTKALIYNLWMKDGLDTKGLLHGLEVLTRNMDDTRIIAYLATNSTAGNDLGLKTLAHEFAGNWAIEEIKDIRKVPLDKLLQYNLVDGLSTNYAKKKYYPMMVKDNQEDLYHSLMMPSLKLIIQLELTGMPMNKAKIQEAKAKLEAIRDQHLAVLTDNPVIKTLELLLTEKNWEDDYESRKAKAKNPHKIQPKDKNGFPAHVFNPNSGPQLQRLLYDQMGLPVLDRTETKQPATGGDTLEKLINHTTIPEYKAIIEALIGYGKVEKVLSAFIPAFEQAVDKGQGNGVVWLHGSFNLGGTVSGRLSSSDPNLQNIPAGSAYAKLIKECFMAAYGWLFCGADFNSLEDYISALTTKDPNKLAVYERGFDGHCLRAAYYFKDQLTHIDVDDPKSVNSIKKSHPELRQESKTPTFALTYQGTHYTLMANLGWTEDKAKSIEAAYHDLYKVSDQYIQDRLKQASKDGFVEVAFGLRVRTPLIKQVMWGGSKMPYEAAAEGRTAGNAMGQSYGLLNNRAAVDFFQKVWKSKYRLDILPVALIHDAIYILIRDDVEIVEWANKELINSMRWQELPEIQHPTVKLGANLDIFYPDWSKPITLPNDADASTIRATCDKEMKERKSK